MTALVDRLQKKFLGIGPKVSLSYDDEKGTSILVIECTVRESHSMSARTTEHEIEDGSIITDNIINEPVKLELTGINSNTPATLLQSGKSFVVGTAGGQVGGGALSKIASTFALGSVIELAEDSYRGGTESQRAFKQVQKFFNEKTTCTIITELEVYSKMMLESFVVDRTARTAESLNFVASFKQATIKESEEVEISKRQVAPEIKNTDTEEIKTGNQGKLEDVQESTAAFSGLGYIKKAFSLLF
jgi:hypothetical protein